MILKALILPGLAGLMVLGLAGLAVLGAGLPAGGSTGALLAAAPLCGCTPLGVTFGADAAPFSVIGLAGIMINQANLGIVFQGFKTAFQSGLGMAPSDHERIATRVPSSTREEKYGWIGKVPGIREWIGDRVVQNLAAHDYTIVNKHHELTVGVDRDDLDDDQYGVYAPLFEEMGQATGAHPNELVFGLLNTGFTGLAYDGQPFFDTDHPVIQADGSVASVANTDGGGGTPWFLLATKRALKPILRQVRKEPMFVALDKEDDQNVFMKKEFIYGVDGRSNVGFGFWQFAWGSKQALSKTTYKLARESMMAFKGDHGRPLGIMPDLLAVPPGLEGQALELLNAERDAAGATNVYRNTADLLVTPWLA
jgi:phage major head subunit gpT-like protein